jgi:GT2 family glycosyltransferase
LQKIGGNSATVVPWVLGAALAFRREAFEALGGFDEVFFMYFEEVDLCYRAYAHGWQVHFMSEAEVIHVGGASTDQQRAIMRLQYFESLAQFYRKHYSKSLRTDLVLIVKTFAFFGLARDFLLLQITRDTGKRSYLRVNLKVHRELLFGHWNKRSDQATVVTA